MKRLEREHGRILSVETKFRGDALAEDALAGATTITVADAGDFDEDGGWLTINGQVVEYTECDDDEGIITLAEGLAAAADQGDSVHLYSKFYKEAVDYQEILVELDGEYDNPESVVAELAEGIGDLPEGDRGEAGESCTLMRISDDEWEVVGVGGRPKSSASMQAEADDVYTVTAADVTAGTATMTLSHTPIDESVKGFWGVLPQEPSEYTVSGKTVTWPLDGVAAEGDRLWVHYWYRVEGMVPSNLLLDYQSAGWKYLQIASADTTDRSAVGYDDSAWATGAGAFGSEPPPTWPAPATAWAESTGIWLRRNVTAAAGAAVTLLIRTEVFTAYWNGVEVGSAGDPTLDIEGQEYSVTVPAGQVEASNVLAIRSVDDSVPATYLDVRAEQ